MLFHRPLDLTGKHGNWDNLTRCFTRPRLGLAYTHAENIKTENFPLPVRGNLVQNITGRGTLVQNITVRGNLVQNITVPGNLVQIIKPVQNITYSL